MRTTMSRTRMADHARWIDSGVPPINPAHTTVGIVPLSPLNGLKLYESKTPTVKSSGAVSPAMRATPRIVAVINPLRAAGTTTSATVFHCVAPIASPASRRSPGTKLRTSCAVRVTVGTIRIVSANPPRKADDRSGVLRIIAA